MSLLLKNALVTDLQSKHHLKEKNILIKDGMIESLDGSHADKIIDCKGKKATPGWVDLNASFCDPGYEFKEDINSGTATAVHGGFTDVHLIPSTHPVVETKSDVEYLYSKALPEVSLHVSASVSQGQEGKNLTEMIDLFQFGAVSFSDGDQPVWNTELLLKALQYAAKIRVPIFQNPRDLHLSSKTHLHEGLTSTLLGLRGEPAISESLVVSRDLDILRYSGGKIHFTKISGKASVELIRRAKEEGLSVTCDVSIFHLLFTEQRLGDFDSDYKSLPPYRTEEDRIALLNGLKEGVIDAISSNHRPQDQESKQLEFDLADPGSTALQTFYSALLEIDLPFDLLVNKITLGPRNVLGIEKISIEEGSKAKLTIVDPEIEWKYDSLSNQSKSNNSPYWEQSLKGKVVGTVNSETISFFENVEV